MRKVSLPRALILSLGLHLLLAALFFVSQLTSHPPRTETVTVDLLPMPAESQVVAEKKKKQIDTIPKTKQVVEQDEKSLNNEKPLKDAYLSAHDQRVEKETMARERGQFRNRRDAVSAQTPGSGGENKPSSTAKHEPKTKPNLRDLMGTSAEAMLQRREEREHEKAGGNGEVVKQGTEASRTDDYLKNVNQGAETMLNTREFKYYTYYSRIRRQLSQHWEPSVRSRLDKMFRQGRRIASDQDHVTKLLIVLNEKGNLVNVQVLTESGVTDLDDAAIDAFRAAAPFPNPPKGIVEPDGTVKIRWDFVLES